MLAPTGADGHSLPAALPVKMTDCSSGLSCCRHNPEINHSRQTPLLILHMLQTTLLILTAYPPSPLYLYRSFQILLDIWGHIFQKKPHPSFKICRPHSSFQKELIVMAQQISPFSSGRKEDVMNLFVN